MAPVKLTVASRFILVIAWVIWLFIVASMLVYFQVPSWGLSTSDVAPTQFFLVVGLAIAWSLSLVAAVFTIRHFGLTAPARKGSYSPTSVKGVMRHCLLHLVFWLILDVFSVSGIFLFILSGKLWPIYLWVSVGLALMCYVAPRLRPYQMGRERQG